MIAIAVVITLLCGAVIFLVEKEYKLAVLFAGTMLLSAVVLPFKGITAQMVLSLCFILSELRDYRMHGLRTVHSVLLPYLFIMALSFLLSVVTSEHLHNLSDMGYFLLSDVIVKRAALLYGFLALRTRRSLIPLLYVSLFALGIMTLIGLANAISGTSFWVDGLSADQILEHDYVKEERFRVQATFLNPFDYGFMCVLLAAVHLYAYLQRMESLALLSVAQACCLFGVLSSNCRTILFCYGVCAVVFAVALQHERKKKWLIVAGAALLVILLFSTVPAFRRIIKSVLTIFDMQSTVTGSSLGMRIIQFTAVLSYITGSIPDFLFGRGEHFFEFDLGWENGSIFAVDSDLYGLEGVYLQMLLERGAVGFALYLAMILIVLVFIVRHRRYGRLLYTLGITVFVLYFLFSLMTGELLSFTPSFYLLGYVVANQTGRKRFVERKRMQCPA